MFYDKQPKENREEYKKMLRAVGQLSNLFSENGSPYLAYRAHENIFCRCLEAENLARSDCSADAKKDKIGIGLKTWIGNNDQKVAEFGKLKGSYSDLTGIDLVKKIAEYRNERIRITKNMHGIDLMIYHVVKRVPGAMQILECAFDNIDLDNIKLIDDRGNDNNTYFTDGKHAYHFSISKNTLYMIFDDLELLDTFDVHIIADPYACIMGLSREAVLEDHTDDYTMEGRNMDLDVDLASHLTEEKSRICLPLYSTKDHGKTKYVADGSGLNAWNSRGRKRDPDEIYIPFNKDDRKRNPDFFPPRGTAFNLTFPDGTVISAKVCQEGDKSNPLIGKSIMSNPNKALGKWLLRDVFELPEWTLVTYEMLEKFGVDSVVFTKLDDENYSIDFSEVGTYESFYGENETCEE